MEKQTTARLATFTALAVCVAIAILLARPEPMTATTDVSGTPSAVPTLPVTTVTAVPVTATAVVEQGETGEVAIEAGADNSGGSLGHSMHLPSPWEDRPLERPQRPVDLTGVAAEVTAQSGSSLTAQMADPAASDTSQNQTVQPQSEPGANTSGPVIKPVPRPQDWMAPPQGWEILADDLSSFGIVDQ